jgi:hypothetical protein
MPGSRRTSSPWEDRFRTPTPADLRAAITRSAHAAVELAAETLTSREAVRESVQWRGVWNWTLVYSHNGDPEPAWAYIIPDPGRPRLCIPVAEETVSDLPVKRLARTVRDGVSHAPAVNGVRWPVWDILTKAQVEEVLSLLEFKRGVVGA